MIAPDDIGLINEGGELRRKFIDGLLSQSDPQYLDHLLSYQKYLLQRNAYLRQSYHRSKPERPAGCIRHTTGPAWRLPDQPARKPLSNPARTVQALLHQPEQRCRPNGLQYRRCADPGQLLSLLQRSASGTWNTNVPCTGPHTEDWLFTIAGNPLKSHASQGQKKSFLISPEAGAYQLAARTGQKPFLLLDDIFEKLDSERLKRLFELLRQFLCPRYL